MIEFPITLTSGGSVCLPGHAFAPGAWQQFVDAVKSDAAAAQQAAQAASSSAAEATRQAGLAAQAAEGKGYMYLEDHDNSGTLSLVIADSITDEITLRDNGAGVLEVVYQ